MKACLQGGRVFERDSGKIFVISDVKLKRDVSSTRVINHGDGASVHGGKSDVNALPTSTGPGFDQRGVILRVFIQDKSWAPKDATIAGMFGGRDTGEEFPW